MSAGVLVRESGIFVPMRRGMGPTSTITLRPEDRVRVGDGERTQFMSAAEFLRMVNQSGTWERESVIPIMEEEGNVIAREAK